MAAVSIYKYQALLKFLQFIIWFSSTIVRELELSWDWFQEEKIWKIWTWKLHDI